MRIEEFECIKNNYKKQEKITKVKNMIQNEYLDKRKSESRLFDRVRYELITE